MGGVIGSYQVPYTTISDAISVVTTVVNKYNGQLARQSLATELDMAAAGGGFVNKLAAIKLYGLLEGSGNLVATDLAQTIVLSKDPKQVAKSKAKAFLNYPLYQKLFDRIKDKVPDDDALTNILVEITKTTRIDVTKKLPEIKKYYVDALQYLKSIVDDQHSGSNSEMGTSAQQLSIPNRNIPRHNAISESEHNAQTQHEVTLVPMGFEEIKMGEVRIVLRPDLEDVATAKGLITLYEKKIKARATQAGPRQSRD
jgi:hypothetical protein